MEAPRLMCCEALGFYDLTPDARDMDIWTDKVCTRKRSVAVYCFLLMSSLVGFPTLLPRIISEQHTVARRHALTTMTLKPRLCHPA